MVPEVPSYDTDPCTSVLFFVSVIRCTFGAHFYEDCGKEKVRSAIRNFWVGLHVVFGAYGFRMSGTKNGYPKMYWLGVDVWTGCGCGCGSKIITPDDELEGTKLLCGYDSCSTSFFLLFTLLFSLVQSASEHFLSKSGRVSSLLSWGSID